MSLRALALGAAVSMVFLNACKQRESGEAAPAPAPAEAPTPTAAAEKPAGEVVDDATASVSGKSSPDCVGPIDTGVPETLTIAGRTYERNGYKLVLTDERKADAQPVVGVLANLNDDSAANRFNIERYVDFFRKGGAEWILVAGDTGEERAAIEGVLSAVAKSGLPVLVIAGNRERTTDFTDAVNAVAKTHSNVINGNRVRWVDLHGVDIVTMPGYHDRRYIHQDDAGCQYFKEDVSALAKLAAGANDPVLLLAHGQPRGSALNALDVIAPDKEHIGDPNLNAVIESSGIPFGIFANVKEAGGNAVADLAGAKVVSQNTFSEKLYLNPGAADSLEWMMNDDTTTNGTAALVRFRGKEASYELYRASKLTDAEKAEAEKLLPAERRAPSAQAD